MLSITIKRIENLCKEQEITISFLENSIKISKGSIRTWDRINPSIDKIMKIAEYFNVSSDYLLGLSDSRYSVENEKEDEGLVSLKRARSKMSDSDKKKMDTIMDAIMNTTFSYVFNNSEDYDNEKN